MAQGWGSAFHEFAVEHTVEYVAFVVDGKALTNVSTTKGNPAAPLFYCGTYMPSLIPHPQHGD